MNTCHGDCVCHGPRSAAAATIWQPRAGKLWGWCRSVEAQTVCERSVIFVTSPTVNCGYVTTFGFGRLRGSTRGCYRLQYCFVDTEWGG